MTQVSAQQCLLCDKNNGVYYCYECHDALCVECRGKHDKIPAIKRHNVTDINSIDLSIGNKNYQCTTHAKEFLFYCVKCSDLICSECATSTHNTHHFSEITDIVVEEREKVKEHIQELTLSINKMSSLHEKVMADYQRQQLNAKTTECIKNIESVCKDLQSFIESKRVIKVTKVVDNKRNEEDKFEVSLKNMDSVQKRYNHILSELEKLLFEKHDVTFHSCYRSMQSDIQTLVIIPDEPPLAQEPSFENKILYKEIMEYMESKIDNSLCKNCPIQRTRIEDLQSKYKTSEESFKRDLEKKNGELKSKTKELQMLKRENDELFQFKCSQPNHCRRCGQYIPSSPFYQHACKGRIT